MIDLNTFLNADSLPVAPEFVETLAENAVDTAVSALENLNAPEHIIQLVRNIHELGYYEKECYRSPSHLLRANDDRFDIEGLTIETINLIAKSGGVFHSSFGDTQPRRIAAPTQLGEQP